jgi:hypothetical protein
MIARSLAALTLCLFLAAISPAVPILPPNAPPEIVSVSLSSNVVNSGGTLSGYVVASSNVASVEMRVVTYSFNMTKIAPGEFTVTAKLPRVPRIWRHAYNLIAIARNTRGDQTTRTTTLTIR